MPDTRSVAIADKALGSLFDDILQQIRERSPDLARAMLYCSVPRWFDEGVVAGIRPPEAEMVVSNDELASQLQALPFCEPHPTRDSAWTFRQSFREHLLARKEVRDHWQELHSRAANAFQLMLDATGLEGEDRFLDPDWRDLAIEWAYHLFHVDAPSGLKAASRICAEALAAWQVDFCAEFLAGLDRPGTEIEFLQSGIDALVAEEDAGALPMLQSLVEIPELSPEQASALHYWIGSTHYHYEGRLAPALDRLEKARELTPEDAYVHAEIAAIHAAPDPTWGRLDLARGYADAAKELAPDAAIGYMALAAIEESLEDWESAIAWYQRALQKEPENLGTLLALGRVYTGQGNLARAVEMIDTADRTSPGGRYYITILKGYVYRDSRQYEQARQSYMEALGQAPDQIQAHLALGRLYAIRHQSVKAEESFGQAIELAPAVADGYVALAELYDEQGKQDKAVETCRQAVDKVADAREIYITLSKLYGKQGQIDNVMWAQEQLVERDPAQAYAYHCAIGDAFLSLTWKHGNAREREEWLARAQAEYDKALAIDPRRAWAYISIAELNVLRGDEEVVQASLRVLQDKAPWATYEMLMNLAGSYQNNFQYTAAEKMLNAAVERAPQRIAGWLALIHLHGRLGNPSAAARARETLVGINPALAYDAHVAVGDGYQRIADYDRARAEYRQAQKTDPDSADLYIRLAGIDGADGDSESAIENYFLAAEKGSDLAAWAYARIAAIHREEGRGEEAEKAARRAIRFDAEQADGYIELACLGVVQHKQLLVKEAREHLEAVLPKKQYDLEYALGEMYHLLGSTENAQEAYETCVGQDPDRADAYVGLGRLMADMDRAAEAKAYLTRALEIESAHLGAYAGLSGLYQRQGDVRGVCQTQERIVEIDPAERVNAYLAIGAVYEKVQQFDAAEGQYRLAIELAPWRVEGYSNLASVLYRQEKSPEAKEAYRKVTEVAGVGYLELGRYYEQQGKDRDAMAVYRLAIEADEKDAEPYLDLAELLAKQGRFEEAAGLAGEMRQHSELAYIAQILLGELATLQQNEEAEQTYRRAIELEPTRPEAYWNLAQWLFDLGRMDDAVQVCYQMTQLPEPAYAAYIAIGDVRSQQQQYESARQAYGQAIAVDPEQLRGYLSLAALYRDQGWVEEMEQTLLLAVAIDPDDPSACVMLASLREWQKQWDEAIYFYHRALQRHPRSVEACFGLGRVYEQHNDLAEAEGMYAQALGLAPGNGDLYIPLGRVFVKQGKREKLERLASQLRTLKGLTPEEEYNALMLVAALYELIGDSRQIEAAYQEAIDLSPQRPDAYQALAQSFVDMGRIDDAIRVHRRVATLQPDAILASAEYERIGDLLIDERRYDEAEEVLREALRINPGNAGACYSLGLVYERQDDLDQAITNYERAIKSAPKYGDAYVALARIYSGRNDGQSLDRMVHQILELDLDPAETYDARLLIAAAYQAAGDLERAEQTYQQAIDAYPKRPEAHTNLADLLVRQNRLDEAIEEYHLTIDLQPDAASAVYERIGDLLSDGGRYDEALDALHSAVKRDPTNAGAYYSLGGVHEQRGELDQAVAMYTQAIEVFSKYVAAYIALGRVYGRQGDVESLERMIAQLQGLIVTEAERYDACLVIAEIYQVAGDRQRQEQTYQEAIALDPERTEAYTNLAQLLADQERLDEAIQVCIRMAQQPPHRYSAQVSLGNLLAAQRKYDEARDAYRQAIETDPNQAGAYLQLAFICLQQDEPGRAEQLLHQASTVAPNDPDVHSMLAQFREQQGNWGEAIYWYRRQAESDPGSASAAYERIGDLLIGQERYGEAEQALLKAVRSDPSNAGAHFSLGRIYEEQGDLDRAAERYAKAAEVAPRYADAYIALSRVYRERGDVPRIAQLARQILALGKDDAERYEAYLVMAAAYQEAELYDWALDALYKAADLDPERADAYVGLGQILEIQQRWPSARDAYAKAGQLVPEWQADVHLRIGHLFMEEDKRKEAENEYRRAAGLAPERVDAYFALGLLYKDAERWDEAIQVFRDAAERDVDLACSAYLYIADIYRRLGKLPDMEEACGQVVSLVEGMSRPDYNALRRRGLAHFMQGEYAEAAQALQQALEANEADRQARFYMALNLLCQGEMAQAQGELQRAIEMAEHKEDFVIAIEEAEVLAARTPELPGAREMLEALVDARNRLAQQHRTQR